MKLCSTVPSLTEVVKVALINEVEAFRNAAGELIVRWLFTIRAGDLKDHRVSIESPVVSSEDVMSLLMNLEACGVSLSLKQLSAPDEWMGRLAGLTVFIQGIHQDDTLYLLDQNGHLHILDQDEDAWAPNPDHPEQDDYELPERYRHFAV